MRSSMRRYFGLGLAALLFAAPGAAAEKDAANGSSKFAVAPLGTNNPRNSEAAIIVRKDGSLLLGWSDFYGGTGADDSPARLSGKVSNDGGRSWGKKFTLVENDGGCNVMEVNFLRLRDGRIALFYCQKNVEDSDCRVMMRTSGDEGQTWSRALQISPARRYIALTNGRSIRLTGGRILLEAYERGESFCYLSDDEGQTWRESQRVRPASGWGAEPACVELKDGRVLMLIRTGAGGQFQCLSKDGGLTWSKPRLSQLTGSSSPVSISRIPSTGDLLAVWNHDPRTRPRNRLTSAISKDEGESWQHFRNLEEGPNGFWDYPSITWLQDRALLTYYGAGVSLYFRIVPAAWFYGRYRGVIR